MRGTRGRVKGTGGRVEMPFHMRLGIEIKSLTIVCHLICQIVRLDLVTILRGTESLFFTFSWLPFCLPFA